MPSEMIQEIILGWVTPIPGKGALGTWWSRGLQGRTRTLSRRYRLETRGEGRGKPADGGVNVGEHLSIVADREGLFLTYRGQNRTREIRPSGIAGGSAET